jgi:cytochrome c553
MPATHRLLRFSLQPIRLAAPLALLLLADPALAQDAERGFELFQSVECAACHGNTAQGMMAPALAGTRLSLAEVRRQVRSPRSRRMPDFDVEELSEDDLADIFAYMKGLEAPTLADKGTWWSIDLLNLPTPALPERKTIELHFTHRFSESLTDAGREGLYGLDSFAFPGFWFSYGLSDRIAPYVGRTANLATWEFGVKIKLLDERQTALPISVAANIGGTFLDANGIPNNNRFTIELPIGVRAGNRLAFQFVPIYTTDPDEQDFPDSDSHALALGFGGSLRLSTTYSLDVEYIANVGGFERFDALDQWQAGVTIHVRRHLFQLLVSNSTLTTPDFMAAGSFKTGIKSNVRFGFNLVRTFSF